MVLYMQLLVRDPTCEVYKLILVWNCWQTPKCPVRHLNFVRVETKFRTRVMTQKTDMKRVFNLTVHKLSTVLFFVDVCFLIVVRHYCRHVQMVLQVYSLWWMKYEVAWGRTWTFCFQLSRQHKKRASRALVLCYDWDVVQCNMHLIVSIHG
jgi:hypothetical protein